MWKVVQDKELGRGPSRLGRSIRQRLETRPPVWEGEMGMAREEMASSVWFRHSDEVQ